MKVVVDHDRCEGHAKCEGISAQLFEVRDDDRSHVLIENPGDEHQADAERAVRMCPRQAISVQVD